MDPSARKHFTDTLWTLKAKCERNVKLRIGDQPFLTSEEALILLGLVSPILLEKPYDPSFGDDKICQCGHPYYRHFDTYEEMSPVGCKYCD